MTSQTWTPNRVHALREMIAERLSASQAAARLSSDGGKPVSRDAVLSKAVGIGLRFNGETRAGRPRKDADAPPAEPKPPTPARGGRSIIPVSRFANPIPLPVETFRIAPVEPIGVPFNERPADACAWIATDWLTPGEGRAPCCGHPVKAGSAYCPDHHALSYSRAA